MNPKPPWCAEHCPGARKAQGFAADSGPADPLAAFIWEAPGADEVQEGEAAVGKAGQAFNAWLRDAGLSRDRVMVMNTLRCRWGVNDYPKGQLRKDCESACRHWDEGLRAFSPTHWFIMYHPAAVFRTSQFGEYVTKCLQQVKRAVDNGARPMVLCGDKALECFAPWLRGGVGAWKGHWWEEKQ